MLKHYFHICNPATPEPTGCKNIVSKAELELIKNDSNSVYLIHIHLNWEGRKLSSNYGFDIANHIRTKTKSFSPIIFYSPIQKEYFEAKSEKEIKYKILFGRGSSFIESPFKEQQLTKLADSLQPLNKASLHDVATMLCDLKGIVIDKLNHDLKFDADVDEIIGKATPYLTAKQRELIALDDFIATIKQSIKDKKESNFNNAKIQFIALCNQELTAKGQEKPKKDSTKYKVLFVDDLKEELDKVQKYLGDKFIIEIATTGEKAIQILKDDTGNIIKSVVSDWRLFIDAKQKTYWQPLQGYEVLDFAAKTGIRSLFALTSQADFVVHHLRNLMGIRFSLFKKENLTTADQWNVFSDALSEGCLEAEQRISNIPDSDNWAKNERAIDIEEVKRIRKKNPERNIFKKEFKKGDEIICVSYTSLHEQYLAYHHSQNWQTLFKKVDEKASEVWQYLIELYKNDKGYKGVDILRNKFDLETPKDSLLFPVLVLRRIWIALWYFHFGSQKEMSPKEITDNSKFIFGVIHNQGNHNFEGNKQAGEQTKLCVSIPQVRNKDILPEEKAWLIKWSLLEKDE